MNLLDRHIFKSVLLTCAGAVGLFTFVLMLGNLVKDLLPYLLSGQLPVTTFARLVWMLVPAVAIYALPMGMLTGVLLTLGRLSADSEITAMRAAGLGLTRIARPVLLLGALGAAFGLYVNFESMPRARVQYHKDLDAAIAANPLSLIVPKTYIRNFKGFVIYVGDKQGSVMREFWLWQLDREGRATQLVRAESGRFDYDAAANDLILTLTRAQIEERNPKQPEDFSESPRIGSFEKSEPQRISLARLYGTPTVRQKLQWMTYPELRAEEAKSPLSPLPPGPPKTTPAPS